MRGKGPADPGFKPSPGTEPLSGGLEAERLSAAYGERTVVKNLSFSVGAGELFVLAGPNGSGKTTLLKTLAGLIKPREGRVLMGGRDLGDLNKRRRAALTAFLFQETGPRWPFTVGELVSQGRFHRYGVVFKGRASYHQADPRGEAAALKEALAAAGLLGFEERPVTGLSGGEYQRVLIARALYQEAPFLLLDEPANNLDPKYQLLVMNLLRALTRGGRSALVILHDLNLAALYGDRIALLVGGELRALGPPAAVLRRELLAEVYGVPLGITPHPEVPAVPLVYPPRF